LPMYTLQDTSQSRWRDIFCICRVNKTSITLNSIRYFLLKPVANPVD
jgi:hypothetical protein